MIKFSYWTVFNILLFFSFLISSIPEKPIWLIGFCLFFFYSIQFIYMDFVKDYYLYTIFYIKYRRKLLCHKFHIIKFYILK